MRYIYIHTYTHTYIQVIKKIANFPFATTWMELEGILPSEINQRKTNTVCYHLQVESKT